MSLRYIVVPVTSAEQNCSLLICDETSRAVVVDPGGDIDKIIQVAQKNNSQLEKILITHGHPDHCGGAYKLSEQLDIPIWGPHEAEHPIIQQVPSAVEIFDFPYADAFEPDRWLQQGDPVHFGNQQLLVRPCPGHSPGHVIYISEQARVLWVGDILFKNSIGFYDYSYGNRATLLKSIFEQIWPLGDDYSFVPGHGPISTIAHERKTNPFVGDNTFAWMGLEEIE